MDILLTHPSYVEGEVGAGEKHKKDGRLLHRVVSALEDEEVITDTISHGDTKFMGVCKKDASGIARRLDIRLLPYDQYYYGVLYFTGTYIFQQKHEGVCIGEGLYIYSGRITPLEAFPISSESDIIFDYLDFTFKTLKLRSN